MSKFKVDDKVRAFGLDGVVIYSGYYAVEVRWSACRADSFLPDGRYDKHHAEPSLVLVKRPKVKKMLYPALYKYGEHYEISYSLYETQEAAIAATGGTFIRLLTERGVEVECDE